MVKEYIRPDGYRIRASEKAYNMLYKKNGFVPVGAAASIGDAVKPTGEAAKASKGKGKAAASKSQKADVTKNISGQEEVPKDETDSNPADQDATEQPEGE